MRKLFSILLVFLTIFSIAVPTFAAESKKGQKMNTEHL